MLTKTAVNIFDEKVIKKTREDTFSPRVFSYEMDERGIFCALSTITHLPRPSIRIHRVFSLLKVSIVQRLAKALISRARQCALLVMNGCYIIRSMLQN